LGQELQTSELFMNEGQSRATSFLIQEKTSRCSVFLCREHYLRSGTKELRYSITFIHFPGRKSAYRLLTPVPN